MTTVGLRELRQNASGLMRRVEAGEDVTITVAGRPSARLVQAGPARWHTWNELEDLFQGPADPDWESQRDAVDNVIEDPWERT